MKKSEAFRKAQEAVLGANLPISVKTEVIEVLLWEEHWAKMSEENQAKENADEAV